MTPQDRYHYNLVVQSFQEDAEAERHCQCDCISCQELPMWAFWALIAAIPAGVILAEIYWRIFGW